MSNREARDASSDFHRAKRRRKQQASVVSKQLRGIKRALLEGEKRPAFLEFLKQADDRRGIYALYDAKGRLYYVGKASDLPVRLDQHLKDKHAGSWDMMTLFFLEKKANVGELEGLVIAATVPPGNEKKPRSGIDMRKDLQRFLVEDEKRQIHGMIFPGEDEDGDRLSGHITARKLKCITQSKLASALGISQGRVCQLIAIDKKNYTELRRYIREAGRRDAILLLLEKARLD